MIEAQEVLQEVEDTAAVITLKILPRPGSRPVDVDDKAAVATIAPFAAVVPGGLAQDAKCSLSHELGTVGVREERRELAGGLWAGRT